MIDNNLIPTAGNILTAITVPGTIELSMLTIGSLLYKNKKRNAPHRALARLAIVVPAHNESACIADCIRSLKRCDGFDTLATIFVVADNCSDDTAQVAREAGAQVLERTDARLRGKGHALNFAFGQLVNRYFDGFVVVDADSEVEPNFIREFAVAFALGAQSLQCPYLVSKPEAAPLFDLALRAFNLVRPRGRETFRLSAGILGNGFGLSRHVLERVPYTADSVVEDLEYHIQLVQAGVRVEHLSTTCVRGAMPDSEAGRASQRARWEGGRLRMILEKGPWLLGKVLTGRLRHLELLLELLTFPLAFHAMFLIASAMLVRSSLSILGLLTLALHVAAAIQAGPSLKGDLKTLLRVPGYLVWKIMQLPGIMRASSRTTAWVRTARSNEGAANA
jgi:cellulose synthase/poly-beta-1,6-N-acetylglucosamine synthase-like glycosyltransferase